MAKDKVYRQIEAKASTHPPKVYDLLTFHNSMFEREADSLSQNYVPLTGAKLPTGTQAIPFVVGILAPSAEISGNVLDRSAAIGGADAYSSLTQADIEAMGLADLGSVAEGGGGGGGGGGGAGGASGYNPLLGVSSLSPQQAVAFKKALPGEAKNWADFLVGAGKANGVSPFVLAAIMYAESGYGVGIGGSMKGCRPGGENLDKVCKGTTDGTGYGLMQIDIGTPLNAQWLAKTVAYEGGTIPIYADPKSIIYYAAQLHGQTKKAVKKGLPGASAELRLRTEIASYNAGYPRVIQRVRAGQAPEASTYRANYVEHIIAEALRLIRAAGLVAEAAKPVARDSAPDKSRTKVKELSKSASKAAEGRAAASRQNLTGKDLNNSTVGNLYQTAQKNIIKALQLAQEQMAATPPLRLILNPQSFSVANSKIITDGNWGRNGPGPTIEHWGDAQDVISAQGRVAGFYASLKTSDANLNNAGSPGLTRMARAFSASYQNLMSLYLLYRNNGGLWTEDFSGNTTKPNNLALVGSVYIYYDNTMYIGSFDSFELTEEAEAPFTLSYSFEFTVRATYLLDREGIDVGTDPNKAYSQAASLTAYVPGERVSPTPVVVETVPPAQPSATTVTDTSPRTFLETSEELGSRRGVRGNL